jgi:hypothetical protein
MFVENREEGAMSDKHGYDLASLINTFQEHAATCERTSKYSDYNLPKALLTICLEIRGIKERLEPPYKGDM